ncbi:MAG: hypothetical protein IPP86_11515 [Bacteroidetes bacterium]|nr:hypothetical protein [Bacteroidota bacterium]
MKDTLDSQQLETRRKIWIELSEFYLDTELTSEDFDRISNTFLQSGLELSEIKKIDLIEVFPLLQPNLLNVAGEWAGFNEEWLLSECTKRFNRRKNIFHRLNCKFWNIFYYWMRRDYWTQIDKRILAV